MAPKSRQSFDTVKAIAQDLPGTEETTSYGTPAFKIKGKLYARLHQDGESLVVRAELDQREALMKTNPETYYITEHYRDYPWVLIRLGAVSHATLQASLEQAWRLRAPKGLVQAFDESK